MAILHSCCFWKSLRRGAYASVIYTVFYYGGIVIMEGEYLYMERDFIAGDTDEPKGQSFLERDQVSYSTVIFTLLFFLCSAWGLIGCVMVFYGLALERRAFLVPWILSMFAHIALEIFHFFYLIVRDSLRFEPITAILYTIDFFLLCLNTYCLLCVVSMYQEFKAGRSARNDAEMKIESKRYIPPTSTMHSQAHNQVDHMPKSQVLTTNIFTSNSTTKIIANISNKSPNMRRHSSVLKKHVQFPEDFKYIEEEEILCTTDSNGTGSGTGSASG